MYNNFSSKKTKKVISALLASALVVTSAPITANAATVKKVGVGKSITYNAKATVKKVTVKNKKVVKATKKGKKVTIKGLKAGTTTVTVKTAKKTIKLNVKVGATKIAKKTMKNTMTAGTSQTVSVTATGGKGDTIKFASSNKAVLTVNKTSAKASTKGIAKMGIKAVKEGTAKLTVSSKYTGVKKSFTIKVTAAQPAPTQVPTVVSTPGITTPTATVAATKAPSVVTTPGVTAPGTTNAPGTTDAAQTPGTDATQAPGTTDAASTDAPSTDATQTPGTDATQAPDVPVAEKGNVAVTTNVSGASIKVLSGTSVVAEKTLEGEDLSTTLTDIENGTYTVQVSKAGYGTYTEVVTIAGNTVNVKADIEVVALQSVKVTSETRIQLNFNGEVDAETVKVENFKVSGVTVTSAKLTEDKKSVILETTTMTKDEKYTVTTANLTSNGVAIASAEQEFIGKEIQYELKLTLAGDKTSLISNGQDSVLVTAQLFDEEGAEVKDLDKVEIKFTTTAGSFAENKVTVQNGVATNMLTSEISTSDIKALITATVVSATNKNLLNVTASKNVLMSPSVSQDTDDEKVGVSLVDIAVETNDRIVLYFNKDVKVEDFTKQDTTKGDVYTYDPSKLELVIDDNAKNSDTEPAGPTERSVRALAPVDGNSKALVAILNVNGKGNTGLADANAKALTDNAKVIVKATDKRSGLVSVSKSASTLVSEIRVPSILGVENDGLNQIKITFSEPVQTKAGVASMAVTDTYVADDASHWTIDGTLLNSPKWGDPSGKGKAAEVTVGEYDCENNIDYRNVVTIKLGKTSAGKQIYFTSGKHSVQGSKIGDWANLTDRNNNIVNTQTLTFTIEPDETVPSAEVAVESPEQYFVTFNKPVSITEVEENLSLQQYDKTSAKWIDKFSATAAATGLAGKGGIKITPITKTADGLAKEYIVEVTQDWTYTLNTSSTKDNYYNNSYRLHIEAGKIENPGNGLKNLEQSLLLDDEIMTSPDVVSPEIKIDGVEQIGTTNSYKITMSEPVQIPNTLETGVETITASQTQSNNAVAPNNAGVPRVTVTFISEDNTTTVPAKINRMVDAHDTSFVVDPDGILKAGKWRVVVASISDDVGNTSQTLVVKDFEVKTVTAVDTGFKALWVVAVPAGSTKNPITEKITPATTDDVVYIKFNKQFKTYGTGENAVSTTNYTVNGIAVPTDSQIDVSLKDYNDVANVKNGYTDLVAIHLKAGTLSKGAGESNTVTIGSTIEALVGGALSNGGLRVLNYNAGGGDPYYAWNFGTYTKDVGTLTADVTVTANDVQEALDNTDYADYDFKKDFTTNSTYDLVITGADKADLTISHAGTYDFTGQTFKSLTINTTETGLINIVGGSFGQITATAPNADVTLDGVAALTSVGGETTTGRTLIKDVMDGTFLFKNGCDIDGDIVITDENNGCQIKTDGTSTANTFDGKFIVDTSGDVTFDGDVTNDDINIEVIKSATIVFKKAPDTLTLTGADAANVKLVAADTPTKTALNALGSNFKNETGNNKVKVEDETVGESFAVTSLVPKDEAGNTYYGANFYTEYTSATNNTTWDGTGTLTNVPKTVYAVYTNSDTKEGTIVKLELSTKDSATVTANVVGVTNVGSNKYTAACSKVVVDGSDIKITLGESKTMTGKLTCDGFTFYSDETCKDEITSPITVNGVAGTVVYAKETTGGAIGKITLTYAGSTISGTGEITTAGTPSKTTVTVTSVTEGGAVEMSFS